MARAKKEPITDNKKILDALSGDWYSALDLFKIAELRDSSTAYRAAMELVDMGKAERRNVKSGPHWITGFTEFRLKEYL